MLTADTITDDQLRALRDWARRLQHDTQFALLRGEPGEIVTPSLLHEVNKVRARCAAIFNVCEMKP